MSEAEGTENKRDQLVTILRDALGGASPSSIAMILLDVFATRDALAVLSKRIESMAPDADALRARIGELQGQLMREALASQELRRANRTLAERLQASEQSMEKAKHELAERSSPLLDAFSSIHLSDLEMINKLVSIEVPENKRMRDWLDRVKAVLAPPKVG